MKKAIVIAILLSSAQMQCGEGPDKGPWIALGSLLTYGIYHCFIKNPNVRLKERYDHQRMMGEQNLYWGSTPLNCKEIEKNGQRNLYWGSTPLNYKKKENEQTE